MHLVIFDIDGTLTDTNEIDHKTFLNAVNDLLGKELTSEDWLASPHITDSGITDFIYQKFFARSPEEGEVERIKQRLIYHLEREHALDSSYFQEVPGANALLGELSERQDLALAIATGCWQCAADFKLGRAGLNHTDIPKATADRFHDRAEITNDAIEQAKKHYSLSEFSRVTYVGDGLWDMETCQRMQIDFIGVDVAGTGRLQQAGVSKVLNNYSRKNELFEWLGL